MNLSQINSKMKKISIAIKRENNRHTKRIGELKFKRYELNQKLLSLKGVSSGNKSET